LLREARTARLARPKNAGAMPAFFIAVAVKACLTSCVQSRCQRERVFSADITFSFRRAAEQLQITFSNNSKRFK
jgi:hypothetical protein